MGKHTVCVLLVLTVLWKTVHLAAPICARNRQTAYEVHGNTSLPLPGNRDMIRYVGLHCSVSITAMNENIEMTVLDLVVENDDEKYKKPPGIEKPIHFNLNDNPRSQNIMFEEDDDDDFSRHIKTAIVNMLPEQISTQEGNGQDLSQIQATMDLLKEGENKIVLSDEYKDVVLVLGNTGAGKSTFTQWIASNDSRLISKEVIEGEYIIEDSLNRIGNSTLDSKTTFPELVVDKENNVAYYDFPGFSDTRSPSHDLATSHFIKKTIDHTASVKMIFVVSYPSVRKGVDRQDFINLVKHITELVKDFNKFQDSIALVVTKVDNNYILKKNRPYLIGDSTIIEGIADFLQEAKQDLEQRMKTTETTSNNLYFYDNAVKFIEALLIKTDNSHKKIALFRRPSEPGPLFDMNQLNVEKAIIQNTVINNLRYTFKISDDIGRTISERSKNDINNLVQQIDSNVFFAICEVAETTQVYFDEIIQTLNNEINLFNTSNLVDADKKLDEATALLTKLSLGYNITDEFTQKIKETKDVKSVAQIINDTIGILHINISNETSSHIRIQSSYLELLKNVSTEKSSIHINALAWASSFRNILMDLTLAKDRFKIEINNMTNQVQSKIKLELQNIGNSLINYYSNKEQRILDIYQIHNEFELEYVYWSIKLKSTNTNQTAEYLNVIEELINNVNISFLNGLRSNVEKHSIYLNEVKSIVDKVLTFLSDSERWYDFLTHFYVNLSTYETQSSLMSFGQGLKQLDENELLSLVKKKYTGIQNVTVDKFKLRHLSNVIRLSFQKPEHSCEFEGTLVVKGLNVRLSEILYMTCPEPITDIKIFALNKIFFDSHLQGRGKNLISIIAPTWEIVYKTKITLDGHPGRAHYSSSASGSYRDGNGEDGSPGFSGSSGGNFFGIGETFINDKYLTISANGGDGGSGQNGNDGVRGDDGSTPYIYDAKQYLKDHGLYYNENEYHCHFIYCQYEVYGDQCTHGGNAGRGGYGGYGGYPGVIDIVYLSNNPMLITQTNVAGHMGSHGIGGQPGSPGRRGKFVKFYWAPLRFWDNMRIEYFDLPACYYGNSPNSLNRAFLERPESFFYDRVSLVREYKKYLNENLNDAIDETSMREFLEKIEERF